MRASALAPCVCLLALAAPCSSLRLPSLFAPVERTRAQLSDGIASFYDASSGIWESTWGEHMHHGYYGRDGGQAKEHVQAQVDMVDETLAWANVDPASPPKNVLDVGCGIGGSSRHIARKYGGSGVGITLSPVQAKRAQQLSDTQGFDGRLSFQVADALAMPFADNSFDLVWSMESGEHMPDKRQFVSELARVCKPGGRVIVVAWCHRDLREGEAALAPKEEKLLGRINRAYYLPRWCSAADYVKLMGESGLSGISTDDWTASVRRFWPAVILSALRPRALWGLLRSGFSTLRGALVMPLMIRGQKKGIIKFALVTATKA
jgi:tocopherol O-methyltransferase